MGVEDPITKRIFEMLQDRPRRLVELQHALPLSDFGSLHLLNKLEAEQKVVAECNHSAHSTLYRLPINGE